MKKQINKKLVGVSQQDETVINEIVNFLKGIINKSMIEEEYEWDRLSTSRGFIWFGSPQSVLEVQLVERMVSEHSEFIRFDIRGHDLSKNCQQPVSSWVKDGDSIRYLGFQSHTVDHPLSDEDIEQLTFGLEVQSQMDEGVWGFDNLKKDSNTYKKIQKLLSQIQQDQKEVV